MGVLMAYARWYEIPAKFKSDMYRKVIPHWSKNDEFVTCKICNTSVKFANYITHLRREENLHQLAFNSLYYDGIRERKETNQLKITFHRDSKTLTKLKHLNEQISTRLKNRSLKRFSIITTIQEVMEEEERDLHAPITARVISLKISGNNFVRFLINEKFSIKEEVGDPPLLPKGSRESRRRKIVEKLRRDCRLRNITIKTTEKKDEMVTVNNGNLSGKSEVVIISDDTPSTISVNTDQPVENSEEVVFVSEKKPRVTLGKHKRSEPSVEPVVKKRKFEEPTVRQEVPAISNIEMDQFGIRQADSGKEMIKDIINNMAKLDERKARAMLVDARKRYGMYILPLWCPIDKNRIVYPARGDQCKHAKVFDAKTFLLLNLKSCPICDEPIDSGYVKYAYACLFISTMPTVRSLRIDF